MKKIIYLGVRVEIADKFLKTDDFGQQYNLEHKKTKIFNLNNNVKVTLEKKDSMLIARGVKNNKIKTGVVNFSAMVKFKKYSEIKRVAQIVNVLGNNRLIREKISVFVSERSILNSIPELAPLVALFKDVDKTMPGFIKSGWYYAPEAIF